MKNLYKKTSMVFALGLCMTSSTWAADCKPAHKFDTVTPGTLTIATPTFAPFAVVGNDGAIGGIEGEWLKQFAERECLKVKALPVDFSAAIQYVVTGKADVTAGNWYRTAERAKVVGVSDPLYLDLLGVFSKEGVKDLSRLEGKRVGTVSGYNWVPDLQTVYGEKLTLFPNAVSLAQDLQSGRIDGALDSYAYGIYAKKNGAYKGIEIQIGNPDKRVRASVNPAQIGYVYAKTSTAFGNALNAHIAELHKNGEIGKGLRSVGIDETAANVGEPRLIQ